MFLFLNNKYFMYLRTRVPLIFKIKINRQLWEIIEYVIGLYRRTFRYQKKMVAPVAFCNTEFHIHKFVYFCVFC